MKVNYHFSSSDQIMLLAAVVNLMEDLDRRDVSYVKRNNLKTLKDELTYHMDKNDMSLIYLFLPESFPLKRSEHANTSFTCGWCKERIDSEEMSTHIKGCRVTIDDVRADLSNWLEE